MREKKRYVAFEVISKRPIKGYESAYNAIESSLLRFSGMIGLAGAGLKPLDNYWDSKKQRGLVRVSNQFTDHLKAAMCMTREVSDQDVIVRSLGISGIAKKAQARYIAG